MKTDLQLLDIVDKEGNIRKLKQGGLSYREIGDLIEKNITDGNLNGDSELISLTEKGKALLENNRHLLKEVDKSKWIEPDYKNKIEKIDPDDVFLPARKSFSFRKELL
jgi:predicted transcriptional regulator